MKHFFLFLLLLNTVVFASEHFWQKLLTVEEKFFNRDYIVEMIDEDSNKTKVLDENQTDTLLEEKFHAFDGLILILKKEPYSLDKKKNPFFDPKESANEINMLRLRIEANKKYGYQQAVNRDKIRLQTLMLKQQIHHFFLHLSNNWTRLDQNGLIDYISKQKELFQKIPIKDIMAYYKEVVNQKGNVANQIKENFFSFAKHYYFFESFLDYLMLNANMLTYHSIASELKLDDIINYINKQATFAKANLYLRYVKLDVGRLILFVVVIVFFWLLNYLFYKKLYNYFKARILAVEDEVDDILLENLDNIRRPVSLLVNGIGLQLALEVVNYPQPLSEKTHLYFTLFFIAMGAYILMQLVENIFFIYFQHKRERHESALRAELLNLILSVAKVIIFVAASLLILVKMGVNITGLLASLGIGGLAVALAAQTTLSNFFGLLKIIFDESFSQGDWIATKDVEGTVVEIGFISTKIRTFDNALITVPNAELANTPLKNWSRRAVGRRIKLHIGVTYGSKRKNLQAAIKEINTMLQEHPGIITPQKIDRREIRRRFKSAGKFVAMDDKFGIKSTLLVYLDRFSDSSIDILIYTFSKTTNWKEWLEVKEEVLYKIWEIIEAHNLEFAFPSQTLYFDEENITSSTTKALEHFKRLK